MESTINKTSFEMCMMMFEEEKRTKGKTTNQ